MSPPNRSSPSGFQRQVGVEIFQRAVAFQRQRDRRRVGQIQHRADQPARGFVDAQIQGQLPCVIAEPRDQAEFIARPIQPVQIKCCVQFSVGQGQTPVQRQGGCGAHDCFADLDFADPQLVDQDCNGQFGHLERGRFGGGQVVVNRRRFPRRPRKDDPFGGQFVDRKPPAHQRQAVPIQNRPFQREPDPVVIRHRQTFDRGP